MSFTTPKNVFYVFMAKKKHVFMSKEKYVFMSK